jgi:hypothetical protein
MFVQFTFELIGRGYKHHGAKDVGGRVRWESASGVDEAPYKFQHGLDTYFARKFAREYPEHCEFFRTRSSVLDECFI